MINKLAPDQISSMWPVLKFAIEKTIPPIAGESPDKLNRHLSSLLSGELDAWAVYDKESRKFEAVLITQVLHDTPNGTKSLLLYSLYGYSYISKERWQEGSEAIIKYAKSRGCSRILAYSENEHLIEIAKSYGAQISTFIKVDLDRLINERTGG